MNFLQSIILAIIEGLTEFLPVSSTGHMIIASSMMGIQSNEFVKLFTVAIQFGAILSVMVLYFKRFFKSVDFYFKLFVACFPAAFLGFLLIDTIDQLLESPTAVAISLVLGGVILLFVDKWFKRPVINDSDKISYTTALYIGFFQSISMIPGVSRSAATIIGGMSQKLSRKAAAEFSFFLAVPTMFGATLKKMYDFYQDGYVISPEEVKILLVGNVVAFIVAMLAIKYFITFLQKNGFRIFGWYRIFLGLVILAFLLSGYDLKVI